MIKIKLLLDKPVYSTENMRYIFLFLALLVSYSCTRDEDENTYTGREIEYELFSATDAYNYKGKVLFKELNTGQVEIFIQLTGNRGNEAYYFPAHLHFGAYDAPDADMAAMLTPVDIKTLKSTTIVRKLSNGQILSFDGLKDFDGHIKVHLAADGPDYQIILAAGNIGANANNGTMDRSKMTLCAPN